MSEVITDQIPGYGYGADSIMISPVSLQELDDLKKSVGFTHEDHESLRLAGAVLAEQTRQIVQHWRAGIIASIPHLARHSRTPEGDAIPEYLANSNRRFEKWIIDTCVRSYDQDWLNYQHEIALRHTSAKKNKTDGVRSTPYIPLRDITTFITVMNETIKPYLSAKGHPPEEVQKMHAAWCKSIQLQLSLWVRAYMDLSAKSNEW